jgi:hypothetical protein
MATRNTPIGLAAIGFQVISQTNSTAQGLNSTCIVGKVFHVSVETQDARYRADATAPTTNTGVVLQSDQAHWLLDIQATNLKFFRAAGGTSKISIMAYGYT